MRLRPLLHSVTLLAAACLWPTDRGDLLQLELVNLSKQLAVGDTLRLATRVTGPKGVDTRHFTVGFESSDSAIIRVDPEGNLLALSEGAVEITGRLLQYANAAPATATVYVSRGVVLLGVQPTISTDGQLRYSDILQITGFPLDPDSLSLVSIGGIPTEIAGFIPADSGSGRPFDRLDVIIPIAPAESELLVVHQTAGSGSRSIEILDEDVLEVAGDPPEFDLADGDVRFPSLTVGSGEITFDQEYDLYRFDLPPGDWTFEMRFLGGLTLESVQPGYFVALQAPGDGFLRAYPEWRRASAGFDCNMPQWYEGPTFAGSRSRWSSFTIPIRTTEPIQMDFEIWPDGEAILQYGVSVRAGYESALPPDAAEGNGFCLQPYDLPFGTSSFNIDSPTDHDWFAFTVPGTPARFATTNSENETESNDSRATANLVRFGTRVIGDFPTSGDLDYYAVDLTAGEMLDVEMFGGLLGLTPQFGRTEKAWAQGDVALQDSAGTELLRAGSTFSFSDPRNTEGADARIRYVVPTSGRYYIVAGSPDFGSDAYYALDVRSQTPAGSLTVEVTSPDATVDPRMVLIEKRSPHNVMITRVGSPNPVDAPTYSQTFTVPALATDYLLLVYNADGTAGNYDVTVTHTP